MTRWSDDEPNPNMSYADAWDEGTEACQDGLLEEACPYSEDKPNSRMGWLDGWNTFNYKIRGPWEDENNEHARV